MLKFNVQQTEGQAAMTKSTHVNALSLMLVVFLLSSCALVRPGQVGVKQKMGALSDEVRSPGPVWYIPLITKVVIASTQINDIRLSLSLPSREGLSVVAEISILYRLNVDSVPKVIRTFGLRYENTVANVFKSASADICAQYFAKDMHSGKRAEIEEAIKIRMGETLEAQGVVIEAVLMKSIQLPAGLASSIEQKLQAEQDAMRMEFILQIARQEAERKIIEAKGISEAQIILSKGLTEQIIKIKSLEAFSELSKSPNSKIIITDGEVPFLIE